MFPVKALCLYIQKPDGGVYEKIIFTQQQYQHWMFGCHLFHIPVLDVQECIVYVGEE